jgi:hypothetical protein
MVTPCLSFFALQHLQTEMPLFSLTPLSKRLRSLSLLLKSATFRVWLPSLRFSQLFQPSGASFNSQHSWAFPYRALFLLHGRYVLSKIALRSCAFSKNLEGLLAGASAVSSRGKSCPPHCVPNFSFGSEAPALPGFGPLRYSPYIYPLKVFYSLRSPLDLSFSALCSTNSDDPQGFSADEVSFFPFRMLTYLAFLPTSFC